MLKLSTVFMQTSMLFTELNYADSQYPDILREISKPPQRLFMRGELPAGIMVAIVGSRRPTKYGEDMTRRLAGELAAAGIAIVSGLAIGIDAIAHSAALEAGGCTVAVLGNGIDHIYPTRNHRLGERILDRGGAIISEHGPGTPALPHHFPMRNRIIAGMTRGVIVAEAAEASGSLITANLALDYNRVVMAVPGNVGNLTAAGPNHLLRRGAVLITESGDVLAALGLDPHQVTRLEPVASSAEEATILRLLGEGLTDSQDLINRSGLAAAAFAHTITMMEITGKVRSLGGGTWIKR
jgi:DNA processing protein